MANLLLLLGLLCSASAPDPLACKLHKHWALSVRDHEGRVSSQYGQDGALEFVFKMIGTTEVQTGFTWNMGLTRQTLSMARAQTILRLRAQCRVGSPVHSAGWAQAQTRDCIFSPGARNCSLHNMMMEAQRSQAII